MASKALDWSRALPNPIGGMREQLARVDRCIDWAGFGKYLHWLRTESLNQFGHEPLVMFKSLLLKQWFQLRSHDFELEVKDRISFRNFIGIGVNDPVPFYSDVSMFGHLIWERGIAEDVFRELTGQLAGSTFDVSTETIRLSDGDTLRADGNGLPGIGLEYFGAQVDFLRYGTEARPPHWREIESEFSNYWGGLAKAGRCPSLADVRIGETGQLRPHLALIRVVDQGEDFVYEFVGTRIEEKNGRALVGASIREKAAQNLKAFGSFGLQGELFALFNTALKKGRPVGSSVYFTNGEGTKCQLWSTVAPLVGDDGRVEMLIGAALIEEIVVN